MESLFVPGWGAPSSLYAPLLPVGWRALEPPTFAVSSGRLDVYSEWLRGELGVRGRCVLAGHSMGGALAILAAAREPGLVARLILVSPAGLPITKPLRQSLRTCAGQVLRGVYPGRAAAAGALALSRAPRSALKLARHVRCLDLRRECMRVRAHGTSTLVVGCRSDTLVRCERTRELADALGAEYVELAIPGGHMWMLTDRTRFAGLLDD